MCILSLQQCKKENKACQPFMKFKLFNSLENNKQFIYSFPIFTYQQLLPLCIKFFFYQVSAEQFNIFLATLSRLYVHTYEKNFFQNYYGSIPYDGGVCIVFCTTFASFSFWISSTFLQCLKCMCKGKNLFSLRQEIQHKSKQHSLTGILAKIHCDKGQNKTCEKRLEGK